MLDRDVVTSAALGARDGTGDPQRTSVLPGVLSTRWRVTSRCAGTGEFALLLADFYRLIRSDRENLRRELDAMRQERVATRRQEQGETRRLRERITLADRIVGTYFRRVTKTVDRTLAALGYHRHGRGPWRRKRGFSMASELARVDIRELSRWHGRGSGSPSGSWPIGYRRGSMRLWPMVKATFTRWSRPP